MNEPLIIDKSRIISYRLTKDNIKKFKSAMESFMCVDPDINKFLVDRISCISSKGTTYDNRDVIYLYFYEELYSPSQLSLIGFISCSASNLPVKMDNPNNNISFPAVKINAFGVDSCYTAKTNVRIRDGKTLVKCSLFMLGDFLHEMEELSYSVGFTHVYLFCGNKIAKFCEKDSSFGLLGKVSNQIQCFMCSLENGKSRFTNLPAYHISTNR